MAVVGGSHLQIGQPGELGLRHLRVGFLDPQSSQGHGRIGSVGHTQSRRQVDRQHFSAGREDVLGREQ